MSNWSFLNQHRCRIVTPTVPPQYISDETYGFNGMFRFPLAGNTIRCIASDGMGWQHVSVSVEYDDRCPRWEVMCFVKELFWEPEDWVVQFHPAKAEYVNCHPGCLHLWKSLDQPFPTPQSIMVGPKNLKLA